MYSTFRHSMAWLHTWLGLVLGFVLMIAFFFGTLSVFDREIDRWAVPETRFEAQVMPSYDNMLKDVFARIEPDPAELAEARTRVTKPLPEPLQAIGWGAYTTHRDPVLTMYSEFAIPNNPDDPADHVHGYATVDPRTGEMLSQDQLKIGSRFFYPLHYGLHLHWKNLGIWIVGVAALGMLAALVSGVVLHRKIFKEFFTFRPKKRTQRSALDLHNLTGVVALPFHFIFALSGLTIFAQIYFPMSSTMLESQAISHMMAEAESQGLPFSPSGEPADISSVDAMVVEAKRRWEARGMPGEVGSLWISHLGDADSYVSIYRAGSDRVTLVGQGVHFKATTGEVIYEEPPPSVPFAINNFLTGLHLQHFEHWLLRWFYVVGGLAGCICIATGFIFFLEKRKTQHAFLQGGGARWVDALATTTVTGMVVATLSILVFSRVLPAQMENRAGLLEGIFWCSWLVSLLHAAFRNPVVRKARISPAWREQCWVIALLAVSAVVLNWITTGDHLLKTLSEPYWPVAGMDLVLLVTAACSVQAARVLQRRERAGLPEIAVRDAPLSAQEAEANHV
ncbi:MAG: PepSY-associated TM helix domain-containing protein [Ketobacter sp.]